MRVLATLLLMTTTAFAGEPLKGADIEPLLNDMTAYYLPLASPSARQYFNKNGETIYVNSAGATTTGSWLVRGDAYCSVWPPSEHYVCYPIEMSKGADGKDVYTFVSGGGGKRYDSVLVKGNQVKGNQVMKPWGG